MLNEWSDRDPDPPSRFDWFIGAVVILGTAGWIAQTLLWLFT
jgi:hypothetical protein